MSSAAAPPGAVATSKCSERRFRTMAASRSGSSSTNRTRGFVLPGILCARRCDYLLGEFPPGGDLVCYAQCSQVVEIECASRRPGGFQRMRGEFTGQRVGDVG